MLGLERLHLVSLVADGVVVSCGRSVRLSAMKRISVRNERVLRRGWAIARSHGSTAYVSRLYPHGLLSVPALPSVCTLTAFSLRLHSLYLTTAQPLPYDCTVYGIDCEFCALIPLKISVVTIVTNDTLFFARFSVLITSISEFGPFCQ